MRDQYAGDISDLLKFAFLRALAGVDRTLGIAWYYASGNDGRPDGRHLEWQGQSAWQHLDAELHQTLSILPERTIQALENSPIWPRGVLFYSEPLPDNSQRAEWAAKKRATLYDSDLIFLDPDNGLSGVASTKHATFAEIKALRRHGRAIVFITFPGRIKHEVLLEKLHTQLKVGADVESSITLRTSVMIHNAAGRKVPRSRWFTVADPDEVLRERAMSFAKALDAVPGVKARLDA